MTPHEAAAVVEREMKAQNQPISFFGIKVPRSVAGIVAPLICLGSLFYLVAHVLRMNQLLHDPLRKEVISVEVDTFPWIALYPGVVSQMATTASILVLPVVANCYLMFQLWHGNSTSQRFLGAVLTICVLAASTYLCRKLRQINKGLHDSPGPDKVGT